MRRPWGFLTLLRSKNTVPHEPHRIDKYKRGVVFLTRMNLKHAFLCSC